MKLKKLLALTLAGAVLTAALTACTPLDAAELVYDSIFGGGSSSTGSTGTGSGSTGSTAEDAENRAFAEAYVKYLKSKSPAYDNIKPVYYDIPHLEEFVKAIDEYCTKKGGDWEDTVHNLSTTELTDLATKVGLYKKTYGSSRASLRFGEDLQEPLEQKLNLFICDPFWDTTQSAPYEGGAWFDSVVLTRTDGSKYRFLLSICHN